MSDIRKAPWLKFYTSDWRADPALRMCSYAARGLWADMLTLMHEAEPYGHLLVSGISPTAKDLAGLLGGTEKEVAGLMATLEAKRVFSRTPEGVIYSRRMLRDAAQAEKDRANGKRGGNPNVKPQRTPDPNPPVEGGVNPPHKLRVNGEDKAQKPEARSQNQKEAIGAPSTDLPRATLAPTKPQAGPPRMPTLNDPPARWIPFADKTEIDNEGVERPVVRGWYVDGVAADVCRAAKIDGYGKALDWSSLIGLLRDGFDPEEHILPAIQRIAARPNYVPPRMLAYFDKAIRETRVAA